MMCQLCGKRIATVCINIDINGTRKQQYICEECAQLHKLREKPSSETILKLMGEIKQASDERLAKIEASMPDITCSGCGTTYKDFVKTGMRGCGECYEAFGSQLDKILHLTTPSKEEQPQNIQSQVLKLQLKQKKAIEAEDYEEAARLRDQIARLKESSLPAEEVEE